MKLIQNSTRQFLSEAKKVKGFNSFDALHGYFYARFPYLYISVGTREHRLSKIIFPLVGIVIRIFSPISKLFHKPIPPENQIHFEDTYHGKVVPLAAAKQMVSVREDIHLANLEHVIPYKMARDLILLEPTHIGVLDCPCRAARKNPCKPLDVCIIVGEPFVGMMVDHHPERGRRISQSEALQILQDEDTRGHVHHAFFKNAMLGRFYAICNCCSCCCGAIQSQREGTPMLASSGYQASVDHELCIGCGICESYCQFQAIEIIDNLSQIQPDICMGCGICVSKCTQEAISLVISPSHGIPLELDHLIEAMISASG